MRITHVVVTGAFAGTERYVCEVARRQAERGHDVVVVGGHAGRMEASLGSAAWRSAESVPSAMARLVAGGRRDVVHAHLTQAELAVVLTRPAHRATFVTTRHIAARRGKSWRGRLAAVVVERGVDLEIAISRFVASSLERAPHAVLLNGVAAVTAPYDADSRTGVVLQRLYAEKDTATALRAWAASGLAGRGWTLVVAGDGAERAELQHLADVLEVEVAFPGHVDDVADLLARAGLVIATAPGEPLGLSVLEAMSHGVPVVASASGGHLETLPPDWPWVFRAGDAAAAAQALAALDDRELRLTASTRLRSRQREHFDVQQHVDALLELYGSSPAARRGPRR